MCLETGVQCILENASVTAVKSRSKSYADVYSCLKGLRQDERVTECRTELL